MKKHLLTAIATIALILAGSAGAALAQTIDDIPPGDPLPPTRNGAGISGGTIYFNGALGEYGTIDPLSGAVAILGNTLLSHGAVYTDIAICPDKKLYGITVGTFRVPQRLHRLEPADATLLADIGPTGRLMTGLVCDTDGTLFGSDIKLSEINKSTGAATARPNFFGNACVSAGDLEVDLVGDLYLTCFGGMVRVDRATGTSVLVGVNGNPLMFGLASVNPLYTLWAVFVQEISEVDATLGALAVSNPPVIFFGAATLPRVGACCINGPGTQTPCEITTQFECEQNHHVFNGAGSVCNPDSEAECNELFVMIESMAAKFDANGVTVRWDTSVETDTVGFRVLRQVVDGREKTEETVGPIVPGAGTSYSGATYEVLDDSKRAALATGYVIEDIDIYGKVTRHGPIAIERNRTSGPATVRTRR